MDTAPITGEPVPVAVRVGNRITSGGINVSGVLQITVEKTLDESMVTRILHTVEEAAAGKPQIERFVTRFAKVYTPIVVLIAVLTAIIPSLVTGEWMHWIHTALTFLVISCPCALVLSVPLAFFSGIGAGSKRGILFKGGASFEALCKVKVVAMDKTGTLTHGNFVVQDIVPEKGMQADTLLALAASCESQSSHPIATSIVSAANERKLEILPPEHTNEKAGRGISATVANHQVLCGNRAFLEENGISVPESVQLSGTEVYQIGRAHV